MLIILILYFGSFRAKIIIGVLTPTINWVVQCWSNKFWILWEEVPEAAWCFLSWTSVSHHNPCPSGPAIDLRFCLHLDLSPWPRLSDHWKPLFWGPAEQSWHQPWPQSNNGTEINNLSNKTNKQKTNVWCPISTKFRLHFLVEKIKARYAWEIY